MISQSVLKDFEFIRRASKVVLSMSTFSWWAAWLSDATRIYFPEIGLFHPTLPKEGRYLEVDDDDRYIKIRLPEFYWSNSEVQRQYMLGERELPW